MWADNYAHTIDAGVTIAGIRAEAMRQHADMPALSLFAEVQGAANTMGFHAEIIAPDGERTAVDPETKH